MPQTGAGTTTKKTAVAKPAAKKGLTKRAKADAELLQSLSNRLSILEEKFQRLVVSHRFQF